MTHAQHPAPLWLLITLQAGISAASLVVEIVAGRMIAPYVGMSLYTWTSIIAVVLAGFSVGHWIGGRVAARETDRALAWCGWAMVAAAVCTAAASMVLVGVAGPVLATFSHPLAGITVITSLAFFLPSLFAGVPAPILAVVAMRGRNASEAALGAMFAAGAVGAIGGTLLAGFLFISWLGSALTLALIASFYAVSALVCLGMARAGRRHVVAGMSALALTLSLAASGGGAARVCEVESSYYCIRTVEMAPEGAAPVRLMVIDHLAHGISAETAPAVMFTDHAAMLEALPRMRMGTRGFTSFHIGGGTYSVPRAWAALEREGMAQTVAEIDPEVTRLAVGKFWFDPSTATVLHRDARAALASDATRYDVILGDAFTDIAVPAHLVTQEFASLVARRLAPGGVYAMNLIDSTDRLDALAAMVTTLREIFPVVEVWTEERPPEPGERRVFVLLAGEAASPVARITTRSPEPKAFAALDQGFVDEILTARNTRPLTDDYAPIDRLMGFDPVID
ncbi:fused MFS/spermidine synthase [Vannielia litorea]|uniref:PABS domain-containing protein n=1 Tax=Vannielia litorea TaxID=1217970 RepID=A0A1N6EH89_9RHOB|nr:fused MFS/spermidine synthase [Vannielia litorea]SIN82428.1 hypothetical protein SAMN05444002_0785 [Vannielia litorea]